MNCGLGNLDKVKTFVLPDSMRADTDYDDVLTLIAKYVAKHFDAFCERKLARLAGDIYYTFADKSELWLPRVPVETVTEVALQSDKTTGYEVQSDVIENQLLATGWIYFGSELGDSKSLLRITYTGGYWFNTDEDVEETQPDGSTALTEDLQTAWLLQIQHLWSLRDKLGIGLKAEPGVESKLADYDLLPSVEKVLQTYKLFNCLS